jgi:hypothetical protein
MPPGTELRDDGYDQSETYRGTPVDGLITLVGDANALEHLDAEPLPDESFDWYAVEPTDRSFVTRVLELSDRYCEEMLDIEFRTITRRILARVAARDARALRRSTNAPRCAAGLVWLAGHANGEFGRRGMRTASRLWSWFGVNDCSDRGRSLRRAAGLEAAGMSRYLWPSDSTPLADPAFLHSAFRSRLMAHRDVVLRIDGSRRRWSILDDGRMASINAAPVKAVVAAKDAAGTRALVLLGLGQGMDDADFFALTIPDAHDLVRIVRQALASPSYNDPAR